MLNKKKSFNENKVKKQKKDLIIYNKNFKVSKSIEITKSSDFKFYKNNLEKKDNKIERLTDKNILYRDKCNNNNSDIKKNEVGENKKGKKLNDLYYKKMNLKREGKINNNGKKKNEIRNKKKSFNKMNDYYKINLTDGNKNTIDVIGKNHLHKFKEKIPIEDNKNYYKKNELKLFSSRQLIKPKNKLKSPFATIDEDQDIQSKLKNNINIKKEKKVLSPTNKNMKIFNKSDIIFLNENNSTNKITDNSNNSKVSYNKNNLLCKNRYNNSQTENKINNRNKNIEKLYNSNDNNKLNLNINNNNSNSNINEEKNNIQEKNKIRIMPLSKSTYFENNIYDLKMSEKKKLNKSYSQSDLGEVGEIIEDEGDSEIENDLNELGDNDFINNPKSIKTDSSINFINKKDKKRLFFSVNQSKNVSKFDKNFFYPLKEFIFKKIEKKKPEKFQKITDINELNEKITTKNTEIEKYTKLIEILKVRIKKYDNEIITIEKWIKDEAKKGEEMQQMINYFSLQ